MTRITSTNTYTQPEFMGIYSEGTPDYVHDALCKAGFPNLEQYGIIKFETAAITREHARADFKYRCLMNFCELSLNIAGHQSTWILYGNTPRIFDAGETLEVLLRNDFMRLDALGIGVQRLLPWFHRRAREVVEPFMESEVHQEIVDADHQGLAPKLIVERVNRSLSAEYIERSLLRLRQIVQTAGHWSSFKWAIGISVISIPLIVSGVAFVEHAKSHTMFTTQDQLILFPEINPPWIIGLASIPLSFSCWLFAKWMSRRWLKRAGGKRLVDWANRKGLLIGKWSAVATIVITAVTAYNFFEKWPVWMDRDGKLYGAIAIFQRPQLIEPAMLHTVNPRVSHQTKYKARN